MAKLNEKQIIDVLFKVRAVGPNGMQRLLIWPLICLDIWTSHLQLDKEQELNIFYQIYVYQGRLNIKDGCPRL